MSAPDPIGAVVAVLKADTNVAALVDTRVFGGELPDTETPSMPRKAIVVRYAGGAQQLSGGYLQAGDTRMDVICYGDTPHEAAKTYTASHVALKQLRRVVQASTLVHWCRPAGGPISLRDPDTEWPYVFSAWQVYAAEVAVT